MNHEQRRRVRKLRVWAEANGEDDLADMCDEALKGCAESYKAVVSRTRTVDDPEGAAPEEPHDD